MWRKQAVRSLNFNKIILKNEEIDTWDTRSTPYKTGPKSTVTVDVRQVMLFLLFTSSLDKKSC